MSASSRTGSRMHVTHDVRIEVMKPQDVEGLKEPLCPEPDVRVPRPYTPMPLFHFSNECLL